MKKILSVTMAAAMAVSLAACGSTGSSSAATDDTTTSVATSEAGDATAEGASSIGGIAQVCDVGTIDDESFNQGCWDAVEAYGEANGIDVNYYLPPDDPSDEDRQSMIRQAVSDGYDTVVCVGYLYGSSIDWAAAEYPDVNFIGVDITAGDINAEASPLRKSRPATWPVTPP